MRRLEHLLGRATDHDLAPEDVEALDLERLQVLAHEVGGDVVRGEALRLVLEDRHRHDRVVAGGDDLVVDEARLRSEPVGELRVRQVHGVIHRARAHPITPEGCVHPITSCLELGRAYLDPGPAWRASRHRGSSLHMGRMPGVTGTSSRSSVWLTVVTGTPSFSIRCGRSRRSHSETRLGRVETITSSKPGSWRADLTASKGSSWPTIPSTGPPEARSISGMAVSSVQSAPPLRGSLGIRSAKVAGPSAARFRTASMRSGVAAVRLATMRILREAASMVFPLRPALC